jgi:hypothetical protein
MFLLVLKDLVSYSSTARIFIDRPLFHSKTINKKFLLWTQLNIFTDAYHILLNKYIDIFDFSVINCFIDTSNITNKYGSDIVSVAYLWYG